MAKDPAFLFYSQDFIVGVQTLPFEDRGKYITILCQMHQQGRMDEETIRFIVGSVSVKLKAKFMIDENGNWYNERLEAETIKRNKFTESRRDNGKMGGRPKKDKPKGKPTNNLVHIHKDNLMGNVNEDVNVIDNVIKNKDIEDRNKDIDKDESENFDNLFLRAFDEITCDRYKSSYREVDLGAELQRFRVKCDNDPDSYHGRDAAGLRTAFQYQLQNLRKNGKQTSTTEQRAIELRQYFAAKDNQGAAG